jgi:hypothetical protein
MHLTSLAVGINNHPVEIVRQTYLSSMRSYISNINPYIVNPFTEVSRFKIIQILHKGLCKIRHVFYKLFSKTYRMTLETYKNSFSKNLNGTFNHLRKIPERSDFNEFQNIARQFLGVILPHEARNKDEWTSQKLEGMQSFKLSSRYELSGLVKGYHSILYIPQNIQFKIQEDQASISFLDDPLKGIVNFKGLSIAVKIHSFSLISTHVSLDIEVDELNWLTKRLLASFQKDSRFTVKTRKEKFSELFSNIVHTPLK